MNPLWSIPLSEATKDHLPLIGGKAFAQAELARAGFRVPQSLCITVNAYQAFIKRHGLDEKIQMELNRKAFKDMRWEEIWDAALRIRNLFLKTQFSEELAEQLVTAVTDNFQDRPVAIRSSAPEEDTATASFAGLHDSYINITGKEAIIDHIKKVWASLWSDAALLYRQEIGLDVTKSSIAVLIQEVITGKVSGVAFTVNPADQSQAVVEAIYGLNQGLVDGSIEPDRWYIDRDSRQMVSHLPSQRHTMFVPAAGGTKQTAIPEALSTVVPLSEDQLSSLVYTAFTLENLFHCPQDIEWTFHNELLVLLQSRPITSANKSDPLDKRPWYLSLHRSLENLKQLRRKIEQDLLPKMIAEADNLATIDLHIMTDRQLADEIDRRLAINEKWVDIYWADFIPFAHGMRLLGQVYNDVVRPDDPYEFIELLAHKPLVSMKRNAMLMQMAEMVSKDQNIRRELGKERPDLTGHQQFQELIDRFVQQFGHLSTAMATSDPGEMQQGKVLREVLLKMGEKPPSHKSQGAPKDRHALIENFLDLFNDSNRRSDAEELLDLARASYRLRDDDNIYLGRIENQLTAALEDAQHRLAQQRKVRIPTIVATTLTSALRDSNFSYSPEDQPKADQPLSPIPPRIRARQLIGQPAGPGIATGRARVVAKAADLALFNKDEILICDAIDPNMTFIVPLAAAIVERRGGMLIHGAIIAREYGIACVTGIADATKMIHTGDTVTVDGHLGIVTITHSKFSKN